MRVLVLPDSFKESVDSVTVCKAIREGIGKVSSQIRVELCPFSDGGEGFLDAVSHYINFKKVGIEVTDLTGRRRRILYGWCEGKKMAIIETARIVGLHLVQAELRKPEQFTSFGVGEAVVKAIRKGAKEIVVALGGSGVNDGGSGIAQALGYKLLDKNGKEIGWSPLNLLDLNKIVPSTDTKMLEEVDIYIASDVKNPFYGKLGATYVYGPQKGLKRDLCPVVDSALKRFAHIIKRDLGVDVQKQPGSGSAGGMGGALFAFAKGKFVSGFEWVKKIANLEEKVKECDVIITGEGQLDYQSFFGKIVGEVVNLGRKYGKKVIILAGKLGEGWEVSLKSPDVVVFSISSGEFSKEALLENAYRNLVRTAEQVCKLLMWRL